MTRRSTEPPTNPLCTACRLGFATDASPLCVVCDAQARDTAERLTGQIRAWELRYDRTFYVTDVAPVATPFITGWGEDMEPLGTITPKMAAMFFPDAIDPDSTELTEADFIEVFIPLPNP